MTCKKICIQYKASGVSGGRYKNGQKRCNSCEIYIIYDGLFCPCCKHSLRTKPRSKKFKEKLHLSQIRGGD